MSFHSVLSMGYKLASSAVNAIKQLSRRARGKEGPLGQLVRGSQFVFPRIKMVDEVNVKPSHFSFCSTQPFLRQSCNYSSTYHTNYLITLQWRVCAKIMCAVSGITLVSTPIKSVHNCVIAQPFLFQAVGNTRLKYSHNTSLVQLTQHLVPGWKGCALPEGTKAACQL